MPNSPSKNLMAQSPKPTKPTKEIKSTKVVKSSKECKFPNGTKVSKRFILQSPSGKNSEEKDFLGTVVGYSARKKMYRVAYEDGDEEEMKEYEVESIIMSDGASVPSTNDSAVSKLGRKRKTGETSSDASKRRKINESGLQPTNQSFKKKQSSKMPSNPSSKLASKKKEEAKPVYQPPIPFHRLVNKYKCSCKQPNCLKMLKEYYHDPASVYPDDKMKLMFKLSKTTKRTPKGGKAGKTAKGSGEVTGDQVEGENDENHEPVQLPLRLQQPQQHQLEEFCANPSQQRGTVDGGDDNGQRNDDIDAMDTGTKKKESDGGSDNQKDVPKSKMIKEGKGGIKLQLFNRTAEIMGLPNDTEEVTIAIHHFHPRVIQSYNDAVAKSSENRDDAASHEVRDDGNVRDTLIDSEAEGKRDGSSTNEVESNGELGDDRQEAKGDDKNATKTPSRLVQPGSFLSFLIPNNLVHSDERDSAGSSNIGGIGDLGYTFSENDRFCCIRTKFQSPACAQATPDPITKQRKCQCKFYLNIPFMTKQLYEKEREMQARASERLRKMGDPFYAELCEELDSMKNRLKYTTGEIIELKGKLSEEEKCKDSLQMDVEFWKEQLSEAKGADFVHQLQEKLNKALSENKEDGTTATKGGKKYKYWNDSMSTEYYKLLLNKGCSCGNSDCKDDLKEYFANPNSVYPGNKKQLFYAMKNQNKSRHKKVGKRRSQYWKRAAEIFGWTEERKTRMYIAVCHFHPAVIQAYNERLEDGAGVNFLDFLLPEHMVWYHNLGYDFTDKDRFHCIKTNAQNEVCRLTRMNPVTREKKCFCNLYLNIPFMTREIWKNGLGPRQCDIQRKKEDMVQRELDRLKDTIERSKFQEEAVQDLDKKLKEAKKEIKALKEEVATKEKEKDEAGYNFHLMKVKFEELSKKAKSEQRQLNRYKAILDEEREKKRKDQQQAMRNFKKMRKAGLV